MQQHTFDGVILDLHMPEMNGYETIPYIRRLQPDAFIIVLTTDVMPEAAIRPQKLQIKHTLPKPYAAEEPVEKLFAFSFLLPYLRACTKSISSCKRLLCRPVTRT